LAEDVLRPVVVVLNGTSSVGKSSIAKALQRLGKRRPSPSSVVTLELGRELAAVSHDLQKQVGVILDRGGSVRHVIVGDAKTLFIPELPLRARDRLSGLRLVHTHLSHEPLSDDDLTDLALLRLDHIAAIEVDENGRPGLIHQAHLLPANDSGTPWEILRPIQLQNLNGEFLERIEALEEEFARSRAPRKAGDIRDRALLLHVSTLPEHAAKDSLAELRELARSAGIVVVDEILQRRTPDPKFVVGKGKLQTAIIKAMQLGAEVVVFDMNLSPSQVNALAAYTDLKVLDRTQVILDIFAQHATTREGKLQVELAQLRYLLPRLSTKHTALSRLTGGIGGRGPGETKLEIDRRRARDRIARLEREVKQLGGRRALRRRVRTQKAVPTVAVVGYTNAGKSTLVNTLTKSHVTAEDALFATLNPVSRRLRFPQHREVIITDTVGFIRQLPADLMAAFRTTLEELHEADVLLHVLDSSAHDVEEKYDTVNAVLAELELNQKPTICVLNKIDRAEAGTVEGLVERWRGIPISALDRATLAPLVSQLKRQLWA